MNLPINDDENMTRNRSEYVNQLLERNRQVTILIYKSYIQLEIQIKQERINVKVLNDRCFLQWWMIRRIRSIGGELFHSRTAINSITTDYQSKWSIFESPNIVKPNNIFLKWILGLFNWYDELKSENQTYSEQVVCNPSFSFQNSALKAIVREYQQPAVNQEDESLRVVTKNLEATEAQLKKTEVFFILSFKHRLIWKCLSIY